jgi:hypothetical protein
MRRFEVAGFRHIVLLGAILAALVVGISGAKLRAQTQLADPKDAPKIFASTCSACHKSPQGLAKSGQVAGFLRQHYTTGPEMSAAMAAYLVAAGSAPAARKGTTETAQKQKSKKQEAQPAEHAALTPGADANAVDQRTLRGKQRNAKSHGEQVRPATQPAQSAPSEPARQTAAAPVNETPTASVPAQEAAAPLVVFDVPLPEMPQAPPLDLTQSVFTSSPLP